MQKLSVFNLITLDGHFAGENGDISWHAVDEEFQDYAEKNSNAGGTLLFGRVTYELMASYWPTPAVIQEDPIVAKGMNSARKIVFSRTLKKADWANTRLIKDNMVEEVRKLKNESGKGLTILGSGALVAQLTQERLIDHYQIMVVPVAIGKGKSMFEGVKDRLKLKLTETRQFTKGNVLLCYEPQVGFSHES